MAIANYISLLKNRNFIGYAIPDSFIRAGMFAYIAGSPFVFIELYHVPAQQYGWLFGANAIGIVSAAQSNRILLRHFQPETILRKTRYFALIAAMALFALPFFVNSIWAVIVPLFFFVGSLGLVSPNSTALALANQGHQAGLASAMYGTVQWSVAMLSSLAISRFHSGTLWTMTSVILGCATVSVIGFQILVTTTSGLDSPPAER
jgi:DHA1 family bicyclomycin/chloramphenicol resistance-like MFS transporter